VAVMSLPSPFDRVAETITDRVSDLLGAPISVADGRGLIVASSEPSAIGRSQEAKADHAYLRVPLRLHAQAGEVIVGPPYGDEAISPRLAQVLVELVITQTTMVERSGTAWPSHHEHKNTFIHDLLHGRATDEETILREAKILGMDLAPPRAVLLIDAADFILAPAIVESVQSAESAESADVQVRRRTQLVIGSVVGFFQLPNDTICAYIGDGEVAVLKASNTQNLSTWVDGDPGQPIASWANLQALRRAGAALVERLRADTGASISIGIGRYHPGVCGLSRSYQDARAALSLGRRFHGANGVHCLDGLGIAAYVGVSDERTKIDLATHVLSPLDHEPELIDTLQGFFGEDCCPSSSAARLSIHRNTLSYRLDKIASLTGLNPRRFDDAVQIRLALLLRSM
jgi:carbohydrate diacid regulator